MIAQIVWVAFFFKVVQQIKVWTVHPIVQFHFPFNWVSAGTGQRGGSQYKQSRGQTQWGELCGPPDKCTGGYQRANTVLYFCWKASLGDLSGRCSVPSGPLTYHLSVHQGPLVWSGLPSIDFLQIRPDWLEIDFLPGLPHSHQKQDLYYIWPMIYLVSKTKFHKIENGPMWHYIISLQWLSVFDVCSSYL